MPLFLFYVKTSKPYSDQANAIVSVSIVLNLQLDCAKLVCFCYKFIFCLMAAFQKKSWI